MRCLFAILMTVALSFILGCKPAESGRPTVEAKGKVTKGGEPLQVAGRDAGLGMVKVEFVPAEGNTTEIFGATADERGEFDMPGGMPAGKYKVAVYQWDPYPQTDKLKGQFSAEKTSIVREVTGKEAIVIDLDKP